MEPSVYKESSRSFTLGSISFLTGYGKYKYPLNKINPKLYDYENTKLFLMAAEKTIYKNGINVNVEWKMGQDAIEEYIKFFSAQVINVKEKYRDHAAHSNGIELTIAENCYKFLIKSEKILIKFIENYNL